MELDEIVRDLCVRVPRAIGAILCDFEGESVVCALGDAHAPPEAEDRAREHVPRAMSLPMPAREFLMRLAGAEPCALVHLFEESARKCGAGGLASLEFRYREIEMLIHRLPNDFYLVMLLRRPAITAAARRHLATAIVLLREHVS